MTLKQESLPDEAFGRTLVATSSRHHGIALFPPPSEDPKDPLRWPRWLKILAILSVALFNFTANFAGAGFSVATPVLEMEFQKSPGQINALLTFNFLLLGIGNMLWVPLGIKFGKRASLLTSMGLLFAVLIWTARATSYKSLLAARCVSGFASAAGESIVPAIVSDLFFLHERAAMMSIYVILASGSTAIGPLVAGFVITDYPGTWRTFTWVCVAIAGFNLAAIFLFYPESNFQRPGIHQLPTETRSKLADAMPKEAKHQDLESKPALNHIEDGDENSHGVQHVNHTKVSFPSIWLSYITYNRENRFLKTFLRPFALLSYTAVLWAIFVYGTALASQVILIFAFPSLLLAPPYLFKPTGVGLIQLAALIGFLIACFGGGYLSDIITTRRIIKQGGQVYPEQRLWSLLPGCFIAPAGCIVVAFACAHKLSWIAIAFGFGMVSFGTVYAPNIAITYLVDSYARNVGECLVVVNVFKNLVAFVFLYTAVEWVQAEGWIQVYMIMFMLVTLSMLLAIPLYFFGEKLRRISSRWYALG